uniref:Uncharacterized protein n=1 Tax=Peronospora matthiolae TaxID=2874970 RepID=A0AAV1USL7_9STRA
MLQRHKGSFATGGGGACRSCAASGRNELVRKKSHVVFRENSCFEVTWRERSSRGQNPVCASCGSTGTTFAPPVTDEVWSTVNLKWSRVPTLRGKNRLKALVVMDKRLSLQEL